MCIQLEGTDNTGVGAFLWDKITIDDDFLAVLFVLNNILCVNGFG